MAGARGENQDICGHIVSGPSTYPTPLSPSNHCVLAYSIVRKSPKRVAPYYEAPIRHESCQTTTNEVNFALLHLFGYQFAPRYRDIYDKVRTSLYGFKHPSQYDGGLLLKPIRKLTPHL